MRRISLALALVLLATAADAHAQSLFSSAGLGLPMDAVDGRARALGNVGIGLMGPEVSPTDPAALGLMTAPTAIMTSQPSWVDFDRAGAGESGSFQSTRWPLVGVAYPAWKAGMMSITFGSLFDQRYSAERPVTADFEAGPVRATDSFLSEGGVSRVNLGWGRSINSRLAVGVTLGRYSGRVIRRLVREFDEVDVDATTEPYQAGGRWTYAGTSVTGGASMQFGTVARVAGSITWGGTLKANASEDTQGASTSYALPTQMRIGGSGLLAPGLLLSASYSRGDWTETGADLTSGTSVGATASYGVGIELTRASLLGRDAPLRLGYRTADLPFQRDGGAATESAFTAGLGMVLNESAGLVLASLDLGVEKGERKDLTLVESFWRATLTLRVAGF